MLMKFSKLLVLSALLAASVSSAKAGVPDGVWTMQDPQGLEFTTFTDDGTRYYLYNPTTKMFFSSGNGWNTMASLRTFGMEMWLQESTEADAPEGSYELWDNNVNNSARNTGEHNIFTDDGNASWVDHGTQGNYSWAYEIVGDCVRFQNVALIADKPEFTGMYLGFDGTFVTAGNTAGDGNHRDAYTAILRHVDPSAPGVSVDWKAVTPESYEAFVASEGYQAYTEAAKQYIASIGLKVAIEEAEKIYIDVTAALAIYTNTASTADQMMTATSDLNKLIDAKKKLQAAIEDYEGKGFSATGDAKAVLTNPQATLAEVEQAHKDLDAAFIEWGKSQASVENPSNMTTMIVNYSFDNGDCATGWSGTAFGRGGTVSDGAEHYSKTYDTYQKISGLAPGIYAVGVNGYYRAGNYGGDAENHWLANDAPSKAAKFYGVVGDNYFETSIANVLSGAQPENQNVGDVAVNYTDENGDPVTVYAPNTMAAGDYYFHTLHQYANKLYVAVDEAGELTIGVKKPTTIGGDWSMFDDFSLTFFGNGADAWKLFLEDGWNYEELELDEDEVLFTASYLEAYNAIATQDLSSLNTPEQIKAALAEVKAAYDALQKNIDLWKQWKAAVQKTNDRVTDLGWTDPWTMQDGVADYLYEVEDIEMDRELTNEELEAEIAKIAALIEACEKFAKENLKPGTDVTFYIQNADFESGVHTSPRPADPNGNGGDYGTADGWHADKFYGGNFTPGPAGYDNDASVNHCFEAWHCWNFDLWQEVNDLPAGVYQIDVQGYVRCEATGYNAFDELPSIPVKLYMNNSLIDFPDVYSEEVAEEHYLEDGTLPKIEDHSWNGAVANYPNSMGAAGLCFSWGMYKKSAFGLVKEGQPMRIGVKSVNMNEHWWCIWDNFKLTYQGFLPEYVKPALQEAVATVNIEGLLIGADVRANVEKILADAEALMAETHDSDDTTWGRAMYDLLDQIYDVKPAVDASVILFDKLSKALTELENAMYEAVASADVQNEAAALKAEVENGIFNETFTDAQAQEYIDKINVMMTRLVLPDFSGASDQNPVNMTAAIKSASYEALNEFDELISTDAGWTGNNEFLGINDDQKAACAMEAYFKPIDLYQDIIGLPEGTYILQVDGLIEMAAVNYEHSTQERFDDNYQVWTADKNASAAFLYGSNGAGQIFSAPITNLMNGAPSGEEKPDFNDDLAWEETVAVTLDETTYWWPTSLRSARAFLDLGKAETEDGRIEGAFTSKVVLKVNEDGKLRVGIKKDPQPTNVYWVVWDDFRLYYYGKNSTKGLSGNPLSVESIAVAQPVKVEFFTLDGRKTTNVQKGIVIQKITLDNGTVVVRKVRK